jgi:hypothetical protein
MLDSRQVPAATIRVALTGAALGLGCGASAPGPTVDDGAKGRQCRVQLPPRSAPLVPAAPGAPSRKAPLSQIVVHLEAALGPLAAQLEERVQKRLAEGRAGIGPGGTVSYSAERGALSVSTTTSALVIETPVQARAEACRGASCYASCEPRALVRAEVPLMLRPDYGFAPAAVSLRFTQGCKVRALGGFLTIDLTPTIEAELAPELRKVGRQIDRQLPDLRAEAEKLWRELLLPRELPLGACVVLEPSELVQGPLAPSRELLRARFAVLARPELRSQCAAPSSAAQSSLPPLRLDSALPEEGVVQLGMVTPLERLAKSLASDAKVTARGSDVDVALTMSGEVCGELAFSARPDFSGHGEHVGLTSPQSSASERQRLLASQLDPATLLSRLTSGARVAPLLSVEGFRVAAPALASAQSQPKLDISARVSSTRAAGAAARGEELVAWLEARGSVTLRPK